MGRPNRRGFGTISFSVIWRALVGSESMVTVNGPTFYHTNLY